MSEKKDKKQTEKQKSNIKNQHVLVKPLETHSMFDEWCSTWSTFTNTHLKHLWPYSGVTHISSRNVCVPYNSGKSTAYYRHMPYFVITDLDQKCQILRVCLFIKMLLSGLFDHNEMKCLPQSLSLSLSIYFYNYFIFYFLAQSSFH